LLLYPQFIQDFEVFEIRNQLFICFDLCFKNLRSLQYLLGVFNIVPEAGFCRLVFQFLYFEL